MIVLLLVGVPGNVRQLATYTDQSVDDRREFRTAVLEAPRIPVAKELPREFSPAPPTNFSGLTLGWLLDSLPSGRIPAPRGVTSAEIASLTMHLALRPGKAVASSRWCRRLAGPRTFVLARKQPITLKAGLATIAYLPPEGDPSPPEAFAPPSLTSFVYPLPVRVTPLGDPIVVCVAPSRPIPDR
jgi:hypothetical protein